MTNETIKKNLENVEYRGAYVGLRGDVRNTEVVDSIARANLKSEVEEFNKETDILTLGVSGSYCPATDPVPSCIIEAKKMKVSGYSVIGNNDKIELTIEWQALYRFWEEGKTPFTQDRKITVEFDQVGTDTLFRAGNMTSVKDFLLGERTERTFTDTLHRFIRVQEKQLAKAQGF